MAKRSTAGNVGCPVAHDATGSDGDGFRLINHRESSVSFPIMYRRAAHSECVGRYRL
jgi:hypothetical protein